MEHADHLLELGVVGRPVDTGGPHRGASQRGVSDEEPGVHPEPALEAVEVVGEALPVPREVTQGVDRDAFDHRHHPHHVFGVTRREGRDREAAVAAHDGGDAVRRRGARRRVPQELGVVVRVDVDEAGCHDQAVGVERAAGGLVDRAIPPDRHDATVPHTDIGAEPGRAGAVDDGPPADQHVQHGYVSSRPVGARPRRCLLRRTRPGQPGPFGTVLPCCCEHPAPSHPMPRGQRAHASGSW